MCQIFDTEKSEPSNIFYTLVSQPNGNTTENCLTTFKPDNNSRPMWYDRPCIENDGNGEPGHRFVCECDESDELNNNFGRTLNSKVTLLLSLFN